MQAFFGSKSHSRKFKLNQWSDDDADIAEMIVGHYDTHHYKIQAVNDDIDMPFLIPKTIHFIWLGSTPLPQFPFVDKGKTNDKMVSQKNWNEAMYTWYKHHTDWEIKVWNESDVLRLYQQHEDDGTNLKEAFEESLAIQEYGLASDIARLEILSKLGGVYVDIDYLCVGSLSKIHQNFQFYCGASNTGCIEINNGIIGSTKDHPLIMHMKQKIQDWNRDKMEASQTSKKESSCDNNMMAMITGFLGEESFEQCHSFAQSLNKPSPMEIISSSGPGLMTRTLFECFRNDQFKFGNYKKERVAVLPFHYFHALPNEIKFETMKNKKEEPSCILERHIGAETIAVHLWSCSWQ